MRRSLIISNFVEGRRKTIRDSVPAGSPSDGACLELGLAYEEDKKVYSDCFGLSSYEEDAREPGAGGRRDIALRWPKAAKTASLLSTP